MPSGAKRRRAAKKKKEKKAAAAIIPNGNGEVKVIESDGGENSSPASQDLETQQNPFTKDKEDREPSLGSESGEDEKMMNQDEDVVEIVVEASLENANDGRDIKKSSNGSLSRDDEEEEVGSQVVAVEVKLQKGEKEESELVAVRESSADVANHLKDAVQVAPLVEAEIVDDQESSAEVTSHVKDDVHVAPLVESEVVADQELSAEVASHVKDAVHVPPVIESELDAVVMEKVIHQPESVVIEKTVRTAVTELNSKKYEEKVHPSETFSDLKAESLPVAYITETPREFFVNQLPQSNTRIGNGESHAESSDNHQCPEKEPLLLPASGSANKTSWTNCCGLFELFTGSSR